VELGLKYTGSIFQITGSNSTISSSVDITGSLEISGSVTGSSYTGSFTGSFLGDLVGTASIATTANTASFVARAQGADDLFITVKNNQATTILKGQAIQAIGVTGENLDVITASNDSSANMPAIGIANENITTNAAGTAIIAGRIIGVNTDGFTAGDNVYVNTNGGFTQTKPTGTSLIQNIGVVAKVNATEGEIVVMGAGRSNDVPNIQAGYAWVGNENQVATAISTGSLNVATAVTASHTDGTSSFADTATSASYAYDLLVANSLISSGSTIFGDVNTDNTRITGSLLITGSTNSIVTTGSIEISGSLGVGTAASGVIGAILASNDVVAFASSDERLKENITLIENPLDKIIQISGYEYDWIPMEGVHVHSGHDIGVIAQEIEKVFPEIVSDRENGYKAVKYDKLVSVLIEGIKELKQEVDLLKKKIDG
jgi:hypothetical protein